MVLLHSNLVSHLPQDDVGDAYIPHLPLLEHLVLLAALARVPPEPDAQIMMLKGLLQALLHPCSSGVFELAKPPLIFLSYLELKESARTLTRKIESNQMSLAKSRLLAERKEFRKTRPFGFSAKPMTKADGEVDIMKWDCLIPGAAGTPWEGG